MKYIKLFEAYKQKYLHLTEGEAKDIFTVNLEDMKGFELLNVEVYEYYRSEEGVEEYPIKLDICFIGNITIETANKSLIKANDAMNNYNGSENGMKEKLWDSFYKALEKFKSIILKESTSILNNFGRKYDLAMSIKRVDDLNTVDSSFSIVVKVYPK